MPKDNKRIISAPTATKIETTAKNPLLMGIIYAEFLENEGHCNKFVTRTLDRSASVIVDNTLQDPTSESLEPLNKSLIDKAEHITDSYYNVLSVVQNIFTIGMLYGRAIFDEDIEKMFEGSDISPQMPHDSMPVFEDMIKDMYDVLGPEKMKSMLDDVSKQQKIQNEQPEDRGPSREEDPGSPEG